MELNLRPKNFKLSADVESHIRGRVERLVRPLENVQSCEVALSKKPTHLSPNRLQYRVQLTVRAGSDIIRSEVENPEVLTAFDQAVDRLSRQIERHKARFDRKRRSAVSLGKASADIAEADDLALSPPALDGANGAQEGTIVRVKTFSFAPMFPEDAVDQMELLGHSFFVFWNATEERLNVLYKRNDGNYGLIQPDFS